MVQNKFPLKGDAARAYEAHKVPAIFEPLAARTLEQVEIRPGARVLDVACGTGLIGKYLAEKGFKNISGCDISSNMLE